MSGPVTPPHGTVTPDVGCPACGEPTTGSAQFCEGCGQPLDGGRHDPAPPTVPNPTVPNPSTAPTAVGAPAGSPDHSEVDLGTAAGVSDRGLVHSENEDAMGVAVVATGRVAVVCDGVSSAPGSAAAARIAAATTADVLADGLRRGADVRESVRDAVAAARAALTESAPPDLDREPACTLVTATLTDGELTVGWIGDSRVYVLRPDGAEVLTEDDTLAAEAVRAGVLPPELVDTVPGAHTLTHWLGAGDDGAPPHVKTFDPRGPGRIVVCSDGLWNYFSAPEALAELARGVHPHAAPVDLARHLVDAANQAGGRDNITVAVIEIPDP